MYLHENICPPLTGRNGRGRQTEEVSTISPMTTTNRAVNQLAIANVISLLVVPPSRLRLSPSPQLPVADGTSVQFNCTSERASPMPTFEWYKNDQLIQR